MQTRALRQAPPGHEVVEKNGRFYVRKKAEPRTDHTLAFRIDLETAAWLTPFFETFPKATVAEGMRWLLGQGEVRDLIDGKILADRPRRRKR